MARYRSSGINATQLLLLHIKAADLPQPELEYRFAPPRRWRFDLFFREQEVAVEINGGSWINGRHNRGSSYERDLEKLNAAMELNILVFQFTPAMVESGEAINQLKRVLQ